VAAFTLGIGTSGPQVVEGFHGVPFDATARAEPARSSRSAARCGAANGCSTTASTTGFRLPADHGTGLGKPLKLINQPCPRTNSDSDRSCGGRRMWPSPAEIADGWKPVFYVPECADAVWGSSLRKGHSRRDSALGALDIITQTYLTISDDKAIIANAMNGARPPGSGPVIIGGMGAKGKNFYHDLACRYGYQAAADTVQDPLPRGPSLLMQRRRFRADLIRKTQLIGSRAEVAERLAAFAASGVTDRQTSHLRHPNSTRACGLD